MIFIVIVPCFFAILILERTVRYYRKRTEEEIDKVNKYLEFYDILIHWIGLIQEQKKLTEYFKRNEYRTVAIYGMKEIGMLLLSELRREGIEVSYAVDRNADEISADITILKPSCAMPEVDVIIVTALHYFDKIYLEIRELTNAEIVSVEDILWAV